MYGEGGENCVSEYRLVNCTLSELSHCSCSYDCFEERPSSSRRKATGIKPVRLEPADVLAQLSVKQILQSRKPTLIDRLIYRNKFALMEPKGKKRRQTDKDKNEPPRKRGRKKRNPSPQQMPNPAKRLRSSIKESEDDQTSTKQIKKKIKQKDNSSNSNKNSEPSKNSTPQESSKQKKKDAKNLLGKRYITRISQKKVNSQFSLRSGRKAGDMKQKKIRLNKNFVQLGPVVRAKRKIDTNSNVFKEDVIEKAKEEKGKKILKVEEKNVNKKKTVTKEEVVKKRRKKKKKCSMTWVNKQRKVKKTVKKEESEDDDDEEEEEEDNDKEISDDDKDSDGDQKEIDDDDKEIEDDEDIEDDDDQEEDESSSSVETELEMPKLKKQVEELPSKSTEEKSGKGEELKVKKTKTPCKNTVMSEKSNSESTSVNTSLLNNIKTPNSSIKVQASDIKTDTITPIKSLTAPNAELTKSMKGEILSPQLSKTTSSTQSLSISVKDEMPKQLKVIKDRINNDNNSSEVSVKIEKNDMQTLTTKDHENQINKINSINKIISDISISSKDSQKTPTPSKGNENIPSLKSVKEIDISKMESTDTQLVVSVEKSIEQHVTPKKEIDKNDLSPTDKIVTDYVVEQTTLEPTLINEIHSPDIESKNQTDIQLKDDEITKELLNNNDIDNRHNSELTIEKNVDDKILTKDESFKENIEPMDYMETHDADSTSDAPKSVHDTSLGDLSLFLPDDELELLKPQDEQLPDSTKMNESFDKMETVFDSETTKIPGGANENEGTATEDLANKTIENCSDTVENDGNKNEIDEDKGEIDENKGEIDEDKGEIDENKGEIDEDKCEIDEDKGEIDEDKGDIDEDKGEIDEALLAQVQTQLEQQETLSKGIEIETENITDTSLITIKQEETTNSDIVTAEEEYKTSEKHNLLTTDVKDKNEELTNEQRQMKESVLHALGLKSLSGQGDEKQPKRSDGYTGTLKAVIKLNRTGDKKPSMIYKRTEDNTSKAEKLEYRICSEGQSNNEVHEANLDQKADEDPIYSNNFQPGSPSEDSQDDTKGGKEAKLIIPEKSSSFSIHPGRLCSDVCSYCFGKFGSLDTPCHVAQLKGEERQKRILENEPHLTGESCLCDACYRFVDRKSNCPNKPLQGHGGAAVRSRLSQSAECCVTGCKETATRTMKRKWLIKLKKSINNKLDIDTEKPGHGMYYPLCTQHHNWVEYFTVCGICRKRLNRNNLFSLGLETDRLNLMLAEDGIPARLLDNLFLCKLCRYYSDLRLKYPDTEAIPPDKKAFYRDYRRKILNSLDIPLSESDDDSIQDIQRGSNLHKNDPSKNGDSGTKGDAGDEIGGKSEDVMSLRGLASLFGEQPQPQARIQVKFGNVNIGTLSNLNIGQGNSATTKTTSQADSAASYSEATALSAQLEYQGSSTPDGSWERYTSTIMFDKKTKQLWTELQRPYGNQSSFLRHLVMLEKVWRAGFLTLVPGADERAVKYITSAKNRILAFEGTPMIAKDKQPGVESKAESNQPTQPPQQQQQPQVQQPVASPPPPLPPSLPQPPTQPSATSTPVKPPFPLLTNTGEIEVMPIKAKPEKPGPPQLQIQPAVSLPQTHSLPQISITAQPQRTSQNQQSSHPPPHPQQQLHMHQRLMQQQQYQQMMHQRKITPLDRAKSLVRMAPPHSVRPNNYHQQHSQNHPHQQQMIRPQQRAPRYYGQVPSQPPPLLKLGHGHFQPNRPILPKLPRALTVVSMPSNSGVSIHQVHQQPQQGPAITLRHSGITIEKQVAPRHHFTPLPIEKPSISVFREPSTQT